MPLHPDDSAASTPAASAAIAQTRVAGRRSARPRPAGPPDVEVVVGRGVGRACSVRPYERQRHDPLYRPLRIYSLDPSLPHAVSTVKVSYEPLGPGPRGAVLEVVAEDPAHHATYSPLDLDSPEALIAEGLAPTCSDHRFHLQMVYAVASITYDTFRTALGRVPSWGFDPRRGEGTARLRLRPFGASGVENAWYDATAGEICFGYYRARDPVYGLNMPGGWIFTALSHDIIVHEVTHALLDGLRTQFLLPTRPDVLAFHEGFADLIAYLLHFSYQENVLAGIREAKGDLRRGSLLTELARQFGQTTGGEGPLRGAIEERDEGGEAGPETAALPTEPYALGAVLVNAVFDAYVEIFERKTRRYLRLATGGTGVLRPGDLPDDLQALLAKEASRLAGQFLRMIIRGVDYCPPVDLTLGEFLRAVVTADFDLVPDDPWRYRQAWIEAFARRRIYPPNVTALTEDALLWQPPPHQTAIAGLSFGELRFDGDPARPAGREALEEQADALRRFVGHRNRLEEFGLVPPGRNADPPVVESIRTSRRVGPDGQVVFDLIAEITQRQLVPTEAGVFETYGGSTVIVGPRGTIRYIVVTRAEGEKRQRAQTAYATGEGAEFWQLQGGLMRPLPDPLERLHLSS